MTTLNTFDNIFIIHQYIKIIAYTNMYTLIFIVQLNTVNYNVIKVQLLWNCDFINVFCTLNQLKIEQQWVKTLLKWINQVIMNVSVRTKVWNSYTHTTYSRVKILFSFIPLVRKLLIVHFKHVWKHFT